MLIVLLGPPGAGKGTQGAILQERYNLLRISTGDLVREEIAKRSELGRSIQQIVESGKFPSDEIIINMVSQKLRSEAKGWIFDGVPRTRIQAEMLDILLTQINEKINVVIELKVDEKKLEDRISSRYTCARCGHLYSKYVKPQREGLCDNCGSRNFIRRADDSVETLKTRLSVYHEKTEPLVEFYKKKGIFHEVNGMAEVEDVTRQIEGIINALQRNKGLERKSMISVDF